MSREERRWTAWALAVMVAGAGLRLYGLSAMEFKGDEQVALSQAMAFLDDRLWASFRTWPTHGMLSSSGVGNAPLFTWVVAAVWAIVPSALAVAAFVAIVNVVSLYPLWRWACRRMDHLPALLTLAICAVSPFAVHLSRKIWTQELLLPGLLALFWALEWFRAGKHWRGVALLLLAVLLVGQLHQSGPIALSLLPIAITGQYLIDAVRGRGWRWPAGAIKRPSNGELAAIVLLVAVNLMFWLPFLGYLRSVPAETFAERPQVDYLWPPVLLQRVEWQVMPVDLFYFFEPHRGDFLSGPARTAFYYASCILGWPLFYYGVWRWLRASWSLPVLSLWWPCVIAAFALARIPTFPFYTLILAPLPAVLAGGAFDGPITVRWLSRLRDGWRIAYVVAIGGLAVTTQVWLVRRGGAAGDYGIAYDRREAQARVLMSQIETHRPENFYRLGELRATESATPVSCQPVPPEVLWIAHRVRQSDADLGRGWRVCDTWLEEDGRLVYRWTLRP